VEETALLDTGATENFIDYKTVARLRLGTQKLTIPRPVFNVDRTNNRHGTITHACDLMVKQGNRKERQRFYISNLGKDRFILGYPWFRTFNPDINWTNAQLCGPQIKMETLKLETFQKLKACKEKLLEHIAIKRTQYLPRSGVTPVEIREGPAEINRTHNAIEMAHKYATEHGKEEVILPEEFKRHMLLFSDEEANKFPPSHGEGDHKIELMDTAPASFNCKVYPLSRKEQEAEDKFLDENLAKGYIVPSHSPYGFSTFSVPKKDLKETRYIINYRPLNAVTRKDVTPLPNLAQCYNPPSFSFYHLPQAPSGPIIPPAPTTQTPQNISQPTAPPLILPRARTPALPMSFSQAIPAIPITWPTHMRQHSSMEYFEEPTPMTTDPATDSDGDSPMRDRSPSPPHAAYQPRPSGSNVYELEANKQPSPPWKAWLSQPSPPTSITRPVSPSSETLAPKRQRHDDGTYTPITSPVTSPISPTSSSAQATPDYQSLPSPRSMGSDQDPNTESPPMLLE